MSELPAGKLTFLFTDIEGSTQLWDADPEAMKRALSRHNAILSANIGRCGGTIHRDRGEGDSFFATFAAAQDAVAAACAIQRALRTEPWPPNIALRIRIAVHSGEAEPDYWAPVINRCARLRALAYGGQTLLSAATEVLTRDRLPDGASLHDLGEHRLRDLARPERIYQLNHPELPADFPALLSLAAYPNNLPFQLTTFIGRKQEIARVKDLLGKASLVTLTGAAGCGKTRLALQLAADLLDRFPDGVWLVELAPLSDPALVAQTVASTVRVREQRGFPLVQTLIAKLQPKRTLIVLDNCEHLVDACARLAEELLHACPTLRILVTSREALNVTGEVTWRVPSLAIPDLSGRPLLQELGQCEGVHLFVDRAMLSRPTFVLTEQNTLAVAQVCDRLDGIPLAIELAAARVKIVSVEQILGFLKDRFRLLTAGSRTALPRQQTLRAAVDWSYELLAESERTLFNRLSVFAGGFTLMAADAVCAAEGLESERLLDLLSALVDKSLVMAAEDGQGPSRYRLLEIFRQYGQERLAKDSDRATQLRHAEYFLKLAVAGEPELAGPQQATWLRRLEDEHDNVRIALRWSMDAGETDIALELAGAIVRFWLMHGYLTEGRQWLTEALVLPSGSPAVRARALLGEGRIAWAQGDYAVARASSQRSLDLVRELGDRAGIASALNSLGVIAHEQGDSVAARSCFEQSLTVSRELGEPAAIARALSNLGSWYFQRREFRAGTALHQEGLALYRMLNDRSSVAFALGNLGDAALEQGDLATARTNFEENLAVRAQQGERVGVAFALERFAALACAESDAERAMRLAGAAASLRAALGSPLYPVERERLEHWLDPVRRALGARADVLMAEGNSMSMEQAIKYAQAVGAPHSGAAR